MAEGLLLMSGICAVFREEGGGKTAGTFRLIFENSSPVHKCTTEMSVADDCAGVGVAVRFGGEQFYGGPGIMLACNAELLNFDELRGLAGAQPGDGAAVLLAALYQKLGSAFVERL